MSIDEIAKAFVAFAIGKIDKAPEVVTIGGINEACYAIAIDGINKENGATGSQIAVVREAIAINGISKA